MDRRSFLAGSLLASAAFALPGSLPSADTRTLRCRVLMDQPSQPIAADFLGLGYEISSVARTGLLRASNTAYVRLVQTLGPRGVIRIGGNTADYSSYRRNAATVPISKGTVVNEDSLRHLGRFLHATGWQLIWCLNLGSGTVAEAVEEARIVRSIAGDRLLAFEIGNEPDLYPHEKHRDPGYAYDAWLADYRHYKSALRAQFPHLPLAGPDAAVHTDWVTRFAADEGRDIVLLTSHYYREGQNPSSTIEKLLAPDPRLPAQLEQLRAASRSCGVPYRICEVNSFSGGGRPGVSDTLAGALWALDYMFTLAGAGCGGVNMETGINQLDFVSSYSPIADDTVSKPVARPEYCGLLAFAHASAGTLLQTSLSQAPGTVRVYAVKDRDTLRITAINKGPDPFQVELQTPAPLRSTFIRRLQAPSIQSQSGVTLGGAAVSADGTWSPLEQERPSLAESHRLLRLPAYSAALVTLVP